MDVVLVVVDVLVLLVVVDVLVVVPVVAVTVVLAPVLAEVSVADSCRASFRTCSTSNGLTSRKLVLSIFEPSPSSPSVFRPVIHKRPFCFSTMLRTSPATTAFAAVETTCAKVFESIVEPSPS